MSICWSIMGVSSRFSVSGLACAFNTIARKPQRDKAKAGLGGIPALNRAPGIAIVWEIAPIASQGGEFRKMTQTSNRFFDEIGRLMNDAAGAAQGVKREVDTVVRNQAERILRDLDIVKREEFEAVKDMARLAREENEALKARIATLEAKLGVSAAAPDVGSPRTDG
jgi:BMFP domain-containing protein YqiC